MPGKGCQIGSMSVPHPCHTKGTTEVMSSHSQALQTVSELGISRSALTVKCPPKQQVPRSSRGRGAYQIPGQRC